jgi:predicted MFS family arabinose efflux permease
MAVGCGLAAANLYYPQPLLHTIAGSFHTGSGTAGLVVTFSQIGYAVGLALVVPVGDLIARRRLVPAALLLTAAALVASAAAPTIGVLIALALVVGLGSVAAQLLVPFAAQLAGEQRRGQVVGIVMSGLLIGILLARTVSGLVAGATGWRVVYAVAAGLVLALAGVLARRLPAEGRRAHLPYGRLLASTAEVFRRDRTLRRRAVFGALGFCGFSIFWTTAAFLLAGPPYDYTDTVIGLFGLVGAAGAACAMLAGRLADRGWTERATVIFPVLVAGSWLLLWFGRHQVGWLIAGIVVLDIGVQGIQVTNQTVLYRGSGHDRSRANAAYMVCYFAGGATGSAVAALLYSSGRWAAVCVFGATVGSLGVIGAVADRVSPVRAASSPLLPPPPSAPSPAARG